jgi:hypothetical protein
MKYKNQPAACCQPATHLDEGQNQILLTTQPTLPHQIEFKRSLEPQNIQSHCGTSAAETSDLAPHLDEGQNQILLTTQPTLPHQIEFKRSLEPQNIQSHCGTSAAETSDLAPIQVIDKIFFLEYARVCISLH